MNEFAQYYQVLGLEITATPAEVKQAYRSLAKKWHPDRFVNQPQLRDKAQQEIQKINQAYEILKDYTPEEQTVSNSTNVRSDFRVQTTKNAPEIHYQRGVEFAETEQYEDAIAEFTLAIKLDHDYLKAYQYRGFILSKLGYELRANSDFRIVAGLKLKQKTQPAEKVNNYNYSNTSNIQYNQYWQCWQTLLAHRKTVSSIIISQNNQFFVSSSHDGDLKLWRTSTGRVTATLKGNSVAINSLALSSSGKILITGNQDRTIRFWNLEQKKALTTLSNQFSKHFKEIIAVALDSRTNTLISTGADNLIKIWDLDRGTQIKEIAGKSADITCLALNEHQGYFCNGGLERQLRIREIKTGKVIRSLRGDSGVFSLAFSPNGKYLAAGQTNCQIQIWNLETGQRHNILIGHQDRISNLTFSTDNKTLISGSWDKSIKLWNIEMGILIDTLQDHKSPVSALAITPDGKTIISGSRDCTIKIWRTKII